MKKIIILFTLVFSSLNVYGSSFDLLVDKVFTATGIRFRCVENVRDRHCEEIIRGLLKHKETLIELRNEIPIFQVNIGQSTKTAGRNGVSVPYDRSSEEILLFLKARGFWIR